MKKQSTKPVFRRKTVLSVIFISFFMFFGGAVNACKDAPVSEKVDAIIIGDRVLDIAYHLGVMPVAMSVRASIWPESEKFKASSHHLGCPNRVTVKSKNRVPDALKEFGLSRVIVEKSPEFCQYKSKVDPVKIAPILEGMDVTIEYVDFSQGLESAINQTAKLLGREEQASALIEEHNKKMSKMKAAMPKEKLGQKVLILSGTYQASTGKSTVRVEAPGGYSDRFFLEPLGCSNVGSVFAPADGKASKGYFPVKKNKKVADLSKLIEVNPDVIVITGDTFAVQNVLSSYLQQNQKLAEVKAMKNKAVYTLPVHIGSSVFHYPEMFLKWQTALVR